MNKQEFLLDTVKYYTTDPERRCFKTNNAGLQLCYYDPKTVGKEQISEGCAIGRHLTPENKAKADKDAHAFTAEMLYNKFPEIFPDWLADLHNENRSFLGDVQCFHDSKENWTDTGLSHDGKNTLKILINRYSLDSTSFNEYI